MIYLLWEHSIRCIYTCFSKQMAWRHGQLLVVVSCASQVPPFFSNSIPLLFWCLLKKGLVLHSNIFLSSAVNIFELLYNQECFYENKTISWVMKMLFPQLYHFVSSIGASFSRVSITCSVLLYHLCHECWWKMVVFHWFGHSVKPDITLAIQ